MAAYFLTSADVDALRVMVGHSNAGKTTQRPVARRRRGPRTKAAGGALKNALITETIPAGTSDGAAVEATPGKGGAVYVLKWNDAGTKLVKDGDDSIEGVNASRTEIRATPSEPIHALGFVETVDDTKRFVVVNVADPRGFTNYGKATKQALYHDADNEHFKLGGENCPDEG